VCTNCVPDIITNAAVGSPTGIAAGSLRICQSPLESLGLERTTAFCDHDSQPPAGRRPDGAISLARRTDNANAAGAGGLIRFVTAYALLRRTPPVLPVQNDRTSSGLAVLVVTTRPANRACRPNSLSYALTTGPPTRD